MIRFEKLEVSNWEHAIRGMRNSWESWDKSDSEWDYSISEGRYFKVGEADLALMRKLVKAGSDHAKFMRMINVSVDIIAPEYWWKEFDTYKVGTVANSTSMMHTLGKNTIPVEAFSFDDETDPLVLQYMDILNQARNEWVESGKKKPSPAWRRMLQLTSGAFLYKRTVTMNYAVLRSMYHSRKNHRLVEWHDLADWITVSLPYNELITM